MIDTYDMKTKELRTVYVHKGGLVDIIAVSISEDRTLILFTICGHVPVGQTEEVEEVYLSYLAEIESGKLWPFKGFHKSRPYLYFLGSSKPAGLGSMLDEGSRTVFFLFVNMDPAPALGAQVWSIGTSVTRNPLTERVTGRPQPERTLVDSKLVWHQFNPKTVTVYFLIFQAQKDGLSLYTLRHYMLKVFKKPEAIFEIRDLTMNLTAASMPAAPESSSFRNSPATQSLRPHSSASGLPSAIIKLRKEAFNRNGVDRRIYRASENLRIVQMGANGACLCQQHSAEVTGPSSSTSNIKVTIYVLHHRLKLKISIPIQTFAPVESAEAKITNTRVLFDSIGDMLLIYVPGHYLQFIDCGEEHDPCPSLQFSGYKFATLLPLQQRVDKSEASPAGVEKETGYQSLPCALSIDTMITSTSQSDLRGHTLLDAKNGIIYEYTLSREAVVKVFDSNAPEQHVYALHLATVHMKDAELVDKIMRYMCTKRPDMLTRALLKEYLVGTPYQEIRSKNMEPHLLALLPVSSMTSLFDHCYQVRKKQNRTFMVCHKLDIPLTPNNKRIINREQKARYAGSATVSDTSAAAPSLHKFIFSFLGLDNQGRTAPESPRNSCPPGMDGQPAPNSDPSNSRWDFVEALTSYMQSCYPKETKSKCLAWAKDYSEQQMEQSNLLLKYISDTVHGFVRFQVLELFHSVLEELNYPAPAQFAAEFAFLGYSYLPRNVFLQYVERKVFRVTDSLLDSIGAHLSPRNPADVSFVYALAEQMDDKHQITRALKSHPQYKRVLVEHFHTQLRNPLMAESELAQHNESFFMPASIFLADLLNQYKHTTPAGVGISTLQQPSTPTATTLVPGRSHAQRSQSVPDITYQQGRGHAGSPGGLGVQASGPVIHRASQKPEASRDEQRKAAYIHEHLMNILQEETRQFSRRRRRNNTTTPVVTTS
eukprot:TRINITY_DN8408_c0_g2_i1.p1 TRINITY_DN8408_c0_g2~~TRINITY_DN8408_c0_g2_i1.p1  ORF type:complete len:1045 (-),score=124.78 TRINITY_DN8408_c0_g2_i1:36-2840(-)